MKYLVLLAFCVLLASAEKNKDELKVKSSKKSADLAAQEARPYNAYQPPPSRPRKNEYGLIHEYPPSGPGMIGDDKARPSPGGYRKGVEPSSGYQSGYTGYDNRGPLLPSAYGKSMRDPNSYSSHSGSSDLHQDTYSQPISGYGKPNSYSKPSSSSYSKPLSGYNSEYSGPSSSIYSKPSGEYSSHSKYGSDISKPSLYGGFRYSKPASSSGIHSTPYDTNRNYGSYSSSSLSGHAPSSGGEYSHQPYSAPGRPSALKPYNEYTPASNSGYAPPPSSGGYAPPPSSSGYAPPPSSSGYAPPPSSSGYGSSSHSGYAPSPLSPHSGYAAPPPPSSHSGYASPPSSHSGYARPPSSSHSGYAPPPSSSHSGYVPPAPSSHSGYAHPVPSSHGGYVPPPLSSQSGYVPPSLSSHGGYVPPPSGSGYSVHSPSSYPVPASHSGYVPAISTGYSAPTAASGYAPSTHSRYVPSSHSGYASAVSYSGQPSSSRHVPKSPIRYSSTSSQSSKPQSSQYGPVSHRSHSAHQSYERKPTGGYSSSQAGGYRKAPSSSYASSAHAPSHGASLSSDAYGKSYGTVTKKEYSKTVETYGSSSGHGGHHGDRLYGNGLARRALYSDHGLYGAASYGGNYNIAKDDSSQAYSEDQSIYGGYGHLY